ncbi:AfsR/SARP family transcriptional regulator [Actinokineospora xionganensis]|uniref:Winged helix-turn-helix domain-containing protein n=1 Tax=Actinokineospora xionganensis TaxID=2684470 RepID=A0ABR7L0V0_9PSEU|nr:BTAD domain-containing putative transcriptional regulator [Actinokineospora xionganensis]MBC6446320.1 winged helix-turn-helix domain-containing protein [Actinokineospora xionganensis]
MEFRLFGPVEAWSDGRRLDVGHTRQQLVLVALLVDTGTPVSADTLVERVWGDQPPLRATSRLYSYVSRLRSILGAAITRERGGYVIDASSTEVDVHRYEDLLTDAGRAKGEAAVALLDEAARLWRGTPFAGFDAPWLVALRESLERRRRGADLDRAELLLDLGRHHDLLPGMLDRAAADPLDERACAQLMLVLYRLGRQAEALTHYEGMRQRLADELGVDPGAPLRELHLRILRLDPALTGPVGSRPRGGGRVAQLPGDVSAFSGRKSDLRRLDAVRGAVSPTAVAIAVITGSAGIGKTALAVHWAHRIRDDYPDGQLFIDLRGHAQAPPVAPRDALSQFLRALGVAADKIPTELDEASSLFRSMLAGTRTIVVLDNAADADQVRRLLPGDPGTLVLITSRNRLGGLVAREGAYAVGLDVLERDDARVLLEGMLTRPRVEAESAAAEELARLCAYLPLALRIAGASLAGDPDRGIADYVTELRAGNVVSALRIDGDEDTAVRAAFDLSYAALSEQAKRQFALLGLVPGNDFTAAAAAALADTTTDASARALDELAAAHLTRRKTDSRYTFHDLLGAYAADLAARQPDHGAAWLRLCAWYQHNLDAATAFEVPRFRLSAGGGPIRFASAREAKTWLDQEYRNVTAAVVRASETGPEEFAWCAADAIRLHLSRNLHYPQWTTVVEAGRRAAVKAGDRRAEGVMLQSQGSLHGYLGESEACMADQLAALECFEECGFGVGAASALSNIGVTYDDLGQPRKAARSLHQGLALARKHGMTVLVGKTLANLSTAHANLGELAEAVSCASECIAMDGPDAAADIRGAAMISRGGAYRLLGEYDAAFADLHAGSALVSVRYGPRGEFESARCHAATGALDLALRHAEQAVRLSEKLADPREMIISRATLGDVLVLRGQVRDAMAHHEQAVQLAAESKQHGYGADARTSLARAMLHLGDAAAAGDEAESALKVARELELTIVRCRAHSVLAQVNERLGRLAEASAHHRESRSIQRLTGYVPEPG